MKFALAVAALALASTSVQAADLIIPYTAAPSHVAGFDWSGFYAGVNAGYIGGTSRSDGVGNGVSDSVDISGGLLGVTLGANAQFDSFVLGLEGDVAWTGAKGSVACSAAPAFTCGGDALWLGTLKGRAGFAVDRALLFATAGLAAGGVRAHVSPAFPGTTGSFEGTQFGYTIGAGVELALNESFSVKAEYSYMHLGPQRAGAGTLGAAAYDLSSNAHVARVGLNFHF
ncbi:outer membrane protein [Devosia sp.]|uniref:outer membrane protein n=1 Tax=Devosia sp. TaxID=1871048 RepID=UPI002AFDF2B3|nr:outer membrane beta-barrel protein [Devosia sp.]